MYLLLKKNKIIALLKNNFSVLFVKNKKLMPCPPQNIPLWLSQKTIMEYYATEHLFSELDYYSGKTYHMWDNKKTVALSNHFLSLMDNFWVIKISEYIKKRPKWENINYFNNSFGVGIGFNRFLIAHHKQVQPCSIISPDNTYHHFSPSFFLYKNNKPHLYLTNLPKVFIETCNKLNLDRKNSGLTKIPTQEYIETTVNNLQCFETKLYTNENVYFMPISALIDYSNNDFKIKSICKVFENIENFEETLKFATTVCIKLNRFLDLSEFGFLLDNKNNFIGIHPLPEFRPLDADTKKQLLPFSDSFEEICNWCGITVD